ncbi:MAG: DUF4271 domain-containing protein [Prevotellaceae bacterium]|jgi:hypothetical protein|nr:DUF4271 domain-containing protein [Prevotellaceae bacterium]
MTLGAGDIEAIPLPYATDTDPWVAIVLTVCFVLSAYAVGQSKSYLLQLGKNFILHKERTNLFALPVSPNMRPLLWLILQTCILSGVYALHVFCLTSPTLFVYYQSPLLLLLYAGIALGYVLIKYGLYEFMGRVLFDGELTRQWVESYSCMIYYAGISFFFPILAIVYLQFDIKLTLIIGFIGLFLLKIGTFYKLFKFFIGQPISLLLLFLYFCALEIAPWLVIYKILIQMNSLLLT